VLGGLVILVNVGVYTVVFRRRARGQT